MSWIIFLMQFNLLSQTWAMNHMFDIPALNTGWKQEIVKHAKAIKQS